MDYLDYKRYLAHYGIPGMKPGVRRFQNEDGSLTAAGRDRYYVAVGSKTSANKHADIVNASKQKYYNPAPKKMARGTIKSDRGSSSSSSSKSSSGGSSVYTDTSVYSQVATAKAKATKTPKVKTKVEVVKRKQPSKPKRISGIKRTSVPENFVEQLIARGVSIPDNFRQK